MFELKHTFAIAATGHAEDLDKIVQGSGQAVCRHGFIRRIIYDAYDSANNVTRTLNIYNPDGILIYTKSSIGDNAHTIINEDVTNSGFLMIPFGEGYSIGMDLSGDAGGSGGTDAVYFYIE